MKRILGFIATLIWTATAKPHSLLDRRVYTTNVTYYVVNPQDGQYCGYQRANQGNITSGSCDVAHDWSLSIQPLSKRDCVYTVFKGTTDCTSATNAQVYQIPHGQQEICVTTGVYDGGAHTYVSGRLTC